jgi:hypothetical protein
VVGLCAGDTSGEDALAYIGRQISLLDTGVGYSFRVSGKDTGEALGTAGLRLALIAADRHSRICGIRLNSLLDYRQGMAFRRLRWGWVHYVFAHVIRTQPHRQGPSAGAILPANALGRI